MFVFRKPMPHIKHSRVRRRWKFSLQLHKWTKRVLKLVFLQLISKIMHKKETPYLLPTTPYLNTQSNEINKLLSILITLFSLSSLWLFLLPSNIELCLLFYQFQIKHFCAHPTTLTKCSKWMLRLIAFVETRMIKTRRKM